MTTLYICQWHANLNQLFKNNIKYFYINAHFRSRTVPPTTTHTNPQQ